MHDLATTSRRAGLARLGRELAQGLRHHGLLLAAAALIFLFGYGVSTITGYRIDASLMAFVERYVVMAGAIVLAGMLFWKAARMVLVERPASPFGELFRWLRHDLVSAPRLVNGAFGMLVVLLLIAGFTQAKNNAVRFPGYNWDHAFLELDRALHFGALPQDLLWPLLGSPLATRFIDASYSLWYALLFASCFAGAFQARRSLGRHRFLLALVFTFGIGGSMLAIVLSSVGPVYFGDVVAGPSPYAAHMARLAAINAQTTLQALETQQILWQAKAVPGGPSLVSAMPSLHVALAALVAMALWGRGGWLRGVSLAFAAVVMLGSVHLGWHYAVDGYAGIAIAAAAWAAALPLSRWYLARVGEAPPD